MRTLLTCTFLGFAILLAGCQPASNTTGTQPGKPQVTPKGTPPAGEPTPKPKEQPPEKLPKKKTPDQPKEKAALKADPSTVTVKAGEEATVKIGGITEDSKVIIVVDPADRQITAVVDKDTLKIRAAKDAKGEATVKVTAGEKSVDVKVTVEP